ncbi:MAG: tetratricopeptide repeat protein [Ardenticatenales bacterium]|nr:tetratricopeptide repeat protein [Ardenticatenales bacterium]
MTLKRRLLAERPPFFLTGPGGIGKTSLALALAEGLRESGYFSDGMVWLDGRELLSYSDLLNEVARQIGQHEVIGHPLEDRERHLLQQVGNRDTFIVLDDLDALGEGRRSTIQFLRQSPVAVLVTTRLFPTGLDLPERLGPLPIHHGYELLKSLLVEAPSFEEVEEVLLQAAGIPLVIRLLAPTLTDGLTPSQLIRGIIRARTGVLNRLRLGQTSPTTRVLLVAIRSLTPAQQELLFAASYLSPSFVAASVAHLLKWDDVQHTEAELQWLQHRGLVEQTSRGWRIHDLLLDTVRTLGSAKSQLWHQRAADFMEGGTLEEQLLAADHRRQAGEVTEAATLLIERSEAMQEAGLETQLAEQLAYLAINTLNPPLRRRVNEVQGDLALQQKQWWEANHYYSTVLRQISELPLEQQPHRETVRLLRKRAELLFAQSPGKGDTSYNQKAEHLLRRALRLVGPEDWVEQIRIALLQSHLYEERARLKDALQASRHALAVARHHGGDDFLFTCFERMAELYRELGQAEIALTAYQSALVEAKKRGDARQQAEILTLIGEIQRDEGNWHEAVAAFERSLPLWQLTSLGGGLANMLHQYGELLIRQGHLDRALQAMQEAQIAARRTGLQDLVITTRAGMAEALLHQGELQVSEAILKKCLEEAEQQMRFYLFPLIQRLLAEVALYQGRFDEAERRSQGAILWSRRQDDSIELYRAHLVQALAGGEVAILEALIDTLPPKQMRYERAQLQLRLAERLAVHRREQASRLVEDAARTIERLGAVGELAYLTQVREQYGL